jgi:hypothetical protein
LIHRDDDCGWRGASRVSERALKRRVGDPGEQRAQSRGTGADCFAQPGARAGRQDFLERAKKPVLAKQRRLLGPDGGQWKEMRVIAGESWEQPGARK